MRPAGCRITLFFLVCTSKASRHPIQDQNDEKPGREEKTIEAKGGTVAGYTQDGPVEA